MLKPDAAEEALVCRPKSNSVEVDTQRNTDFYPLQEKCSGVRVDEALATFRGCLTDGNTIGYAIQVAVAGHQSIMWFRSCDFESS